MLCGAERHHLDHGDCEHAAVTHGPGELHDAGQDLPEGEQGHLHHNRAGDQRRSVHRVHSELDHMRQAQLRLQAQSIQDEPQGGRVLRADRERQGHCGRAVQAVEQQGQERSAE